MIPSSRLLLAALVCLLIGAGAIWLAPLQQLWLGAMGLLGVVALVDLVRGRTVPTLRIERAMNHVWPVGQWGQVALTVHHESGRPAQVKLYDDYPVGWEWTGLPQRVSLTASRNWTIFYKLRPQVRGDARFGRPHLLLSSPWGLFWRRMRHGPEAAVRVFPDFSKLLGHTLRATDQRIPRLGTIKKRRRGEGTDFRQLREYRQGDSLRAIDWKATARQLKPISREYQEERDQQVVFLIDTGRRMLARDDDQSHFDHALNAMLTLAWVAQKQGDAVGVMTFGQETRWLPPQKGRVGLDRMLRGVYDVQATETAPDYLQAADALMSRLRKRAFVVLITNLRDEDDAAMREAWAMLSSKHLVLCASLREAALDALQAKPVATFDDALKLAGTEHYLAQRREAIKRLYIRPHSLIDVIPQQLAPALVDRYLEVKESGLL